MIKKIAKLAIVVWIGSYFFELRDDSPVTAPLRNLFKEGKAAVEKAGQAAEKLGVSTPS